MSTTTPAPETSTLTIDGTTVTRTQLDWAARQLRQYHRKLDQLTVKLIQLPEIVHQSAPPADGMPRGSAVGNPTLARVLQIESTDERITQLKVYFVAVERVRDRLTTHQATITDNLFFLAPRDRREPKDVMKELSISKPEYYRKLSEALFEFVLVLPEEETEGAQ